MFVHSCFLGLVCLKRAQLEVTVVKNRVYADRLRKTKESKSMLWKDDKHFPCNPS